MLAKIPLVDPAFLPLPDKRKHLFLPVLSLLLFHLIFSHKVNAHGYYVKDVSDRRLTFERLANVSAGACCYLTFVASANSSNAFADGYVESEAILFASSIGSNAPSKRLLKIFGRVAIIFLKPMR
jgi:hypothetical protein